MRIALLYIFLLPLVTFAQKGYYVSSSGNNAANGLTPATAWQTLSKVNGFTFASGDSILLNCNDNFSDSLILTRSNLYIGYYNTGKKPVISSEQLLSSWTLYSGNIYYASVTTAKKDIRVVTINGIPQEMGRYPNSDSANGGYLTYETFNAGISITDNQLTGTPDWTGAWVVIRKNRWTADCGTITNQTVGTITYNVTQQNKNQNYGTTPSSPGNRNYGYFFENDLRTLNKQGEWFFDTSTNRLYVYFTATPSSYTVKVATADVLINCKSFSNIKIDGLDIKYSNRSGIYSTLTTGITIKNCSFSFNGQRPVQIFQNDKTLIDSCDARWGLNGGYQIYNGRTDDSSTITNCTFAQGGNYVGLAWTSDATAMTGIFLAGGRHLTARYNRVDTTGRDCFKVGGSSLLVEKNVGNYADFVLDDQGVLYTYQDGTDTAAVPGFADTARIFQNNKFTNGVGNPNGANSTQYLSQGIYLDGRSKNIKVWNNFVQNAPLRGIHTNNGGNIDIDGNLIINAGYAISMRKWPWGKLENIHVADNIVINSGSKYSFRYANDTAHSYSIQSALGTFGTSDSNFYNNTGFTAFITEYAGGSGTKNFATWKTYSGLEDSSTALSNDTPIYYFNDSNSPVTFTFTGSYRENDGTVVTGSAVVQPWTYFFGMPTATPPPTPSTNYILTNKKFVNAN